MGLFSNNKSKSGPSNKKLTLDYHGVVKEMKKTRVEQCQRNGASLSQIGMDLAHLERKARELYNTSVKYVKDGQSYEEAYNNLMQIHAASDVDRLIVEKLFSAR